MREPKPTYLLVTKRTADSTAPLETTIGKLGEKTLVHGDDKLDAMGLGRIGQYEREKGAKTRAVLVTEIWCLK